MQRHDVVMGPQAVCTVTAELSRPEGKTMGIGQRARQPASSIHTAANLKTHSPMVKTPHSKSHSKREQSFAPKAALQN